MSPEEQWEETEQPEPEAQPHRQTLTKESVAVKADTRQTEEGIALKRRKAAWRAAYRFGPTLVAIVLAVGQFLLLQRQNNIIEAQKRAEAADNYVFFLTQEEAVRRLLGTAFDHWYALRNMDLAMRSSIDTAELRQAVLDATPSDVLAREITEKCGVSLYPVGEPIAYASKAIRDLDNGDLSSAKWAAADLRQWMDRATKACDRRLDLMRELRKRMRTEAGFSDSGDGALRSPPQ